MRNSKSIFKKVLAFLTAALVALSPGIALADAGFDSSNWQGCVNAQVAKNAGAAFGIVKVTEGAGYTDPNADCSMTSLRNAGLRRAVYHFARPDLGNSPEAEADWFNSQTVGYRNQGVIPILDWEPAAPYNTYVWWALRWLQRVEQVWGTKPMIYLSAYETKIADWTPIVRNNNGLWLAGYYRGYAPDNLRNPGGVPYNISPWSFAAMWQYSSTANVPGVGSRVDVSWFYGDAATWEKYANSKSGGNSGSATPQPQPQPQPQQGINIDELANAVIRGDYGIGEYRKSKLGANYSAVQDRVNALLSNSSSGSTCSGAYCVTVAPNDTISGIASRTGKYPLSAWQVPSGNINVIYPGQQVCYGSGSGSAPAPAPTGNTNYTGTRVHVVQQGEYLSGIFGSDWQRVAQLNNLSNPSFILPGQVLRY